MGWGTKTTLLWQSSHEFLEIPEKFLEDSAGKASVPEHIFEQLNAVVVGCFDNLFEKTIVHCGKGSLREREVV